MSGAARIMMVVVLSVVWGGFLAAVAVGLAREKKKEAERRRQDAK